MSGYLGLLQLLSSAKNERTGQSGLGVNFDFSEGGGSGTILGGAGYAGKDTFKGNTGKAVASNIFDPGGFFRKKKVAKQPTLEEMLDQVMNWTRSQPEYQNYEKMSGILGESGQNLMTGIYPEQLKAATTPGNEYLDEIIRLNTADIQRAGDESAAARGIRGPRGMADTNREIAEVTSGLRYTDYTNAMNNRLNLFGAGADMVGGVGSQALQALGLGTDTAFNFGNLDLNNRKLDFEIASANSKNKSNSMSSWGDTLGTMMGYFSGGKSGGSTSAAGTVADTVTSDRGSASKGFVSYDDIYKYNANSYRLR